MLSCVQMGMLLARRYRTTLVKLVGVIPLVWLAVTLILHTADTKSESSQQQSQKHRDKHKEARVDLLHNSNRLGETENIRRY